MEERRRNAVRLAPYTVWSVIFIIVPLLAVVYYSFTDSNGAFTLSNLSQILVYKDSFLISILYALAATAICLLIAYPFAYFMTKTGLSVQRSLMLMTMLPMWMNLVVLVNSWTTLLRDNGLINQLLGKLGISPLGLMYNANGVILGMVYCYLPYMILPIYSILSKLDGSLLEASADLGANSFARFRRVILPMSLPGVVSGITMVFVPSISTFYISQALGDNTENKMIGDYIESFFKGSNGVMNFNYGAVLSLVLMVFIIISLAVMNRFSSDDDDGGVLI